MTSTGDNEPTLDGAVMLAAAREIVARLDRQLSDIGSEDVKLTPEAGILTGSFLNTLIEAFERGVQSQPMALRSNDERCSGIF